MMTFHSDLGDSAACALAHDQMVRDSDDYRRDWMIAHGYITDPIPALPRDDIHLCGVLGYEITGSREACPHCKIAAPREGR
jgi:hypothetical protein